MSTFPVGAKVTGDTSGFVTAMAAGQKSLTAFAGAAGLANVAMGALAVVMGAGVAVKMAKDFQAEMLKLNTLVGISEDQIESWGDSIKSIATSTGQMPEDLARAMFAITSGGARGQQALEILEQSAKASAIGLGDMASIGKTATAMLTAFGDTGLTTEKAIDIMVATVQEGNLEAASLAGAFSRVLGPAKSLGSSVEDIGGFLATFTRLGGSTEEAATGLLNVFQLLLSPTEQTRDALTDLEVPLDDIRSAVSDGDLISGLTLLKDALGDNVDALGEVIPSSRAMIAFLNTVGLQADSYAASMNVINEATGKTSEAFLTWADSGEAAFEQFSAQLAVSGMEIGENLLPPLASLLKVMSALSEVLRFSIEGWEKLIGIPVAGWMKFMNLEMVDGVSNLDNWNAVANAAAEAAAKLPPEWNGAAAALNLLGGGVAEVSEQFAVLDALMANASVSKIEQAMGAAGDNLRETKNAIRDVRNELETLGEPILLEDLDPDVYVPAARQAEADRRAVQSRELGRELEKLLVVEREQMAMASSITDAYREATAAVDDAADATEHATDVEVESAEAKAERETAIQGIVDALARERLELISTDEQLLIHDLLQLRASESTIAQAVATLRLTQARIDANAAEEGMERDRARRVAQAERDASRQQADRARAANKSVQEARRAQQAIIRAADREKLAQLQNDLREVSAISATMASTVTNAFDAISDGTESVGGAFRNMVDEIIAELQRLVIQRTIMEPLMGWLFDMLGGAAMSQSAQLTRDLPAFQDAMRNAPIPGADFITPLGNTKVGPVVMPQTMSRITAPMTSPNVAGLSLPDVSQIAAQSVTAPPAPQTIVQQTITFAPQLIDGADGSRWLRQNSGEIMGIVGQGAQESSQYARALRGAQL